MNSRENPVNKQIVPNIVPRKGKKNDRDKVGISPYYSRIIIGIHLLDVT